MEPFVPFVGFVDRGRNVKTSKEKHSALWKKADALADWIDNPDSGVSSKERAAKVPELQKMSMMLHELEILIWREKNEK